MSPNWYEIALSVDADAVDEAVALLTMAGFDGAELRERGEATDVVVYIEADDDASAAARAADAVATLDGRTTTAPRIAAVDPAVWTDNWKQHFARRVFAARIEVVPPWEADSPREADLLRVVINPGMAFGTGLHETTASCLELLVEEVTPGCRVADIGCGSGILAIAAIGLGAAEALATDIDPLAVLAARENAEANGVAERVRIELETDDADDQSWREQMAQSRGASRGGGTTDKNENSAETSGGFRRCGAAAFDVVVANILAETLVTMRDDLAAAVRPGGVLLLSGIDVQRLNMVEEAFIVPGWSPRRSLLKGEWASLSLRRDAVLSQEAATAAATRTSPPSESAPDAAPGAGSATR